MTLTAPHFTSLPVEGLQRNQDGYLKTAVQGKLKSYLNESVSCFGATTVQKLLRGGYRVRSGIVVQQADSLHWHSASFILREVCITDRQAERNHF